MTSGSPTAADGTATRWWQASAVSNPPPSAVPWIAATTGLGLESSRSIMAGKDGSSGGLPNSVMSAPAKKVLPAQVSTIAFTASSSMNWRTPSTIASRTALPSAFTGGESMVMTPMPSSTV